MGHVFHDLVILNHLPISACSGLLTFDMKIFVNVARLEIGQLSRVTEFSIRTEQPLLILFLAYLTKISTFSIKKCSVRLLSTTS